MKWLKRAVAGVMEWTPYRIVAAERLEGPDVFHYLSHRVIEAGTTGVLLDIGANEGQTSARLKGLFPKARIHAFEPGAAAFERLKKNVAGVECHQLALGREPGEAVLRQNAEDMTSSLLGTSAAAASYSPKGWVEPVGEERVKVTSVDEFCRGAGIEGIELLKTDCQGYDHEVLLGAEGLLSRGRVRAVLTEATWASLYEGQGRFEETASWLKARGYRFVGLYRQIVLPDEELGWGDALFLRERG